MKQVDKEHYNFENYSHLDRWTSYYFQVKEILNTKPKSVLEVGVGDRVIASYIKNNTDIEYKSLDIDGDLQPDVAGSVLSIPFEGNSFDTVCIFEVLEHLPFSDFEKALSELKRVSKKDILISVPHFGPPVQFFLKIPFIKIRTSFKIPFMKKHVFNGEHYWEIGKKGYPVSRILKILKKHFIVQDHFVPFENQYHHFFILKK